MARLPPVALPSVAPHPRRSPPCACRLWPIFSATGGFFMAPFPAHPRSPGSSPARYSSKRPGDSSQSDRGQAYPARTTSHGRTRRGETPLRLVASRGISRRPRIFRALPCPRALPAARGEPAARWERRGGRGARSARQHRGRRTRRASAGAAGEPPLWGLRAPHYSAHSASICWRSIDETTGAQSVTVQSFCFSSTS